MQELKTETDWQSLSTCVQVSRLSYYAGRMVVMVLVMPELSLHVQGNPWTLIAWVNLVNFSLNIRN